MIRTNLFESNDSHKIVYRKGRFSILEYERDLSVSPQRAMEAYYASQMNVRKRQVVIQTEEQAGALVQAGYMQLMLGDVRTGTNIKGTGDFFKKVAGAAVTKETVIKPRYIGDGTVVLEPTYKYVLLEDLNDWPDGMVIEDGMFLACDDSIAITVAGRKNLSSALLGGEGFFNSALLGEGVVALESPVPDDELIIIDLVDDELKIDGNMVIAWSYGLAFTVEKSTKTLIGSAVSGEGLVNVYRGTGRVLVAPVENNHPIDVPKDTK